ncbi:hypothetical protein KEM48_004431 [Puccinia striiformis f. sp. tritici PST-130]|nr:hypothetical protein KEM48_004431 [Puccinia striiformis f. sp. tritici PST-130]
MKTMDHRDLFIALFQVEHAWSSSRELKEPVQSITLKQSNKTGASRINDLSTTTLEIVSEPEEYELSDFTDALIHPVEHLLLRFDSYILLLILYVVPVTPEWEGPSSREQHLKTWLIASSQVRFVERSLDETLMSSNGDEDSKLKQPKNSKTENQTSMSKTTESVQMEKTNSVIFVTLIKAIPYWPTRISPRGNRKFSPSLSISQSGCLHQRRRKIILRARTSTPHAILAKLEERVYDRVVNPENEGDIMLIWKSVIVEFASNEAANQERVWNEFSNLPFDNSDVQGSLPA